MKLIYQSPSQHVTIEAEVPDVRVAHELAASLAEVFRESACAKCKSRNIRPDVRVVQNKKYHQIVCDDCRARLDFGQHQNTPTLFAKRKDDNGPIGENGWYVFDGEDPELDRFRSAVRAALDWPALDYVEKMIAAEVKAGRIAGDRRQKLLDEVKHKRGELPKERRPAPELAKC